MTAKTITMIKIRDCVVKDQDGAGVADILIGAYLCKVCDDVHLSIAIPEAGGELMIPLTTLEVESLVNQLHNPQLMGTVK